MYCAYYQSLHNANESLNIYEYEWHQKLLIKDNMININVEDLYVIIDLNRRHKSKSFKR